MKYLGINRDNLNKDTPDSYGIDARNGVNSKYIGAAINESGFKIFQKKNTLLSSKYGLPQFPLGDDQPAFVLEQIGEIAISNNRFVIFSIGYRQLTDFSINPQYSEIGLLDEQGQYTTILNDINFTNPNKLRFNPSKPITGEYTKNYLSQTIIASTDNDTVPLYFNIEYLLANPPDPSTFDINSILMFQSITQVNTNIVINNTGGSLDNGIYYLAFKYKNKDMSVSVPTLTSNPISIFQSNFINTPASLYQIEGDLTDKVTGKSIIVVLNNVNVGFENLEVYAVIKRLVANTDGSFIKAVYLKDVKINSSVVTFNISSSVGTDVPLGDILTPTIKFTKIYKFTQVYNRLYAANPSINSLRTFQRYANLIKLSWASKIIDPLNTAYSAKSEYNYDNKTFLHREVYAFYVHLVLLDGTVTEGFHIPYNRLNSAQITSAGYRDISTLAASQGISAFKFQIEDTALWTGTIFGTAKGELGFWENQNEIYPDTDDFAPVSGSEDLRGQKVRHHRFPSIAYLRDTAYDSSSYGTSLLDVLGIDVNNIVIPDEIKPFIKNVFFSFAERNYNNSTVIGQSSILFQSTNRNAQGTGGESFPTNYSSGINVPIGRTAPDGFYTNYPYTTYWLNTDGESKLRFYDLKLNKDLAGITPVFIANELFLSLDINFSNITNCDGTHNDDGNNAASFYSDFTQTTIVGTSIHSRTVTNIDSINVQFRKVKSYEYLVARAVQNTIDNQTSENCLLLTIDSSILSGEPANRGVRCIPIAIGQSAMDWGNRGDTWNVNNDASTRTLETYLTTLMNLPANVYQNFYDQTLVNTGVYIDVSLTSKLGLYKGDGFISIQSQNCIGWGGTDSAHLLPSSTITSGLRQLFVNIVSSTVNYALRSSDGAVNKFAPKYPYNYIAFLDRTLVVLNTLYSDYYSSINNLNTLLPYNPFIQLRTELINRINRCIAFQSESLDVGWRTWLTNDYFETNRNKGRIINIEGNDRDLIITLEKATFKTVGNEQINIDSGTAFIGIGNIFERPAMEFYPSKEGTIGSQNLFSCLLTVVGYLCIDAEKKLIYILNANSGIEVISNHGMNRWFYENLPINNQLYYDDTNFIELQIDNPYTALGYTVGYDLEFNRFLITKKEYIFTDTAKAFIIGGSLTYSNNKFILNIDGVLNEIGLDNTTFFINTGFTISYDINNKSWSYFHDYYPNKYFNNRNHLFASKIKKPTNDASFELYISRIYRLNMGYKGIYDNTTIIDIDSVDPETATPFPTYIVPIFNKTEAKKHFVNVSWITELRNFNNAILREETFDKILCFTSYQSTPLLDLLIFSFGTYFESNIRNIKNEWLFNDLRDYLREDIETNPSPAQPFIIDYSQLNSSINPIDLNKLFQNIRPLIDYWLAVKLIYNNTLTDGNSKEIRILQINSDMLPVPR